jgi:hypothetical protein
LLGTLVSEHFILVINDNNLSGLLNIFTFVPAKGLASEYSFILDHEPNFYNFTSISSEQLSYNFTTKYF